MAEKPDPMRDQELKLAWYLASAFIAYSHGIGMDYGRRKYAHLPVGPFWLDVARMVNTGTAPANERAVFIVPPDRKTQGSEELTRS